MVLIPPTTAHPAVDPVMEARVLSLLQAMASFESPAASSDPYMPLTNYQNFTAPITVTEWRA
jgi:hypothetical protein